MTNIHTQFVEASGQLAVTGTQKVLYKDLQPEFDILDWRDAPLDAPTFYPCGSVISYDGRPLANMSFISRRLV